MYYLPLWMILAERSMTSDRLNWSWSASALSGRKESPSGPRCSSPSSSFISAGLSACSLPFRPTATDKDQTSCLMLSFISGLQRRGRSLFNQRRLSPSRSQCSRQAAWSLLVRNGPSEPLTFSDCEQGLWRPRHVINHQVEGLKVVEERGRLLIHGHGVDDLQSRWKPLLITGLLITNPCVHLARQHAAEKLMYLFNFTTLLWADLIGKLQNVGSKTKTDFTWCPKGDSLYVKMICEDIN